MANDSEQSEPSRGWIKAIRGEAPMELIRANPLAFVLAAMIAYRARWRDGFNRHGLAQGEAMLGDFENYGMSQKQYRTAKRQLETWGFAAFRGANKGTTAKLMDKRLFSIYDDSEGDQKGESGATEGRARGEQGATNEEGKTGKKGKNFDSLRELVAKPGIKRTVDLMARLKAEAPMEFARYHKRWLARAESNPGKLERCLNELVQKSREEKVKNGGAVLEAAWRDFK